MTVSQKQFIGVDVGGTNIKAALVRKGKIIARYRLATEVSRGLTHSLARLKGAISHFIDRASGIGVGIAGLIDSKEGVVRFSPNLTGWRDVRLASLLEREFNKPVRILNDVDAFCLGEWQYGAARGYDNVFLFTLGTGVGGAAVCEGAPLFGANGFAGEFGHSVINFNGPRCRCGNRGCLERYVGARYIVARAKKKIKKQHSALRKYKELTPRLIAEEARKGDTVSREVFREIAYYIGVGIANIIVLFDPDIIVISGGVSRAGKILFGPIRKVVKERAMGAVYRNYKIVPPELGDDAGILGAVYYASAVGVRS